MADVAIPDQIPVRGVKELVEEGIVAIPEKYIQPENCRAGEVIRRSIPAVDVSGFHGDGKSEVVRAIADAAKEWGFFQVINHGVPTDVIRAMKDASIKFFSLPLEVKMSIFSENPQQRPVRFCSSFLPSKEERWDWHDNFHYRPLFPHESLPEELEFFREPVINYLNSLGALVELITTALALGLGLDPASFDITRRIHTVRLNYYPACPSPELAMGLGSHSDFGGVTVLLQDEEGLQVKNNGQWYSVEPIPGALVINLADQFEILSNGRYQSAEHRGAVNSKQARLSIVVFFQPGDDDEIAPLEELVSGETPARYQKTLYRDYLMDQMTRRLDSKSGIAGRKTE